MKNKGGSTRRWRIMGGTILAGVLVVAGVMIVPRLGRIGTIQAKSTRSVCRGNLRQIGMMVKVYAMDHGDHYPPSLGVLPREYQECRHPRLFSCPIGDAPYGDINAVDGWSSYVWVPFPTEASLSDAVSMFCLQPHGKDGDVHVLYVDGSTSAVSRPEFTRQLRRTMDELGRMK